MEGALRTFTDWSADLPVATRAWLLVEVLPWLTALLPFVALVAVWRAVAGEVLLSLTVRLPSETRADAG